MPFFRNKPIRIEAIQFTGENGREVGEWASKFNDYSVGAGSMNDYESGILLVYTLEGLTIAGPGDWIIRGIKGELYLCKADIFEATYEISY